MLPTRRTEENLGNVVVSVCSSSCLFYIMPEYLLRYRILHTGKFGHGQVVWSYLRFFWGLSYIKFQRQLCVLI